MKNMPKSALLLALSSLFGLSAMVLAGSCQPSKKYESRGLVLLSPETLLGMARADSLFPLKGIVKDSLGRELDESVKESILKAELGASFYADEGGEIKEIVVRPPSLEDELLLIQLVETDKFLEREVPYIPIDCSKKVEILHYVLERDRGARGQPVGVDLSGNIDGNNQNILNNLVRQCGFPRHEEVGDLGMIGVFIVIQHAPPDMRGYYYSYLEEAVKRGEFPMSSLALVMDRMLGFDHKKEQVYGTQMLNAGGEITVLPIRDPENVDKRRAEIGLGPLKDYISKFQ